MLRGRVDCPFESCLHACTRPTWRSHCHVLFAKKSGLVVDKAFSAWSTFSDDGSLSLSQQAVREEFRESGHVHCGAMQPTGTIVPLWSWLWIFDRETSQTKHTHKKVPKDYRQSRRNLGKHHMYSTPVTFVPVTRSQQVSPQAREEALVDRCRNLGEVADLGLTVELLSSVWTVRTRQTPRLLILPFCSILRRCSTNCQIDRLGDDTELRTCTDGRNNTDQRLFFSKLKKLKKNISLWCPGKKESIRVGFKVRCPRIAEIQAMKKDKGG